MSNERDPLGAPDAADEASLFNALVGGDERGDEGQDQGKQDQGQDQGEPEGRDETEAERQDRERDAQGRFAKPEPKSEGKQPQDRAQKGLRNEVTSERGKRQATEAQLDAERRERENDRRELARLQGIVETMQRGQGQAQQQAEGPKPEPAPDMYTQPEEYREWVIRQAEQRAVQRFEQQTAQRIEYSLQDAQQRDPQAFDAAYAAVRALSPAENAALQQRLRVVSDAGTALINWHKAHQARQEIGADPVAYRERLRAEVADPQKLMQDPAFVQAVTDLLRQQAGQGGPNGGPRTTYTPIPSLNGARGGNTNRGGQERYDDSDRGVFEHTMRS